MLSRAFNGCLSVTLMVLIGAMAIAAIGGGMSWKGRAILGGVALVLAGLFAIARCSRRRSH